MGEIEIKLKIIQKVMIIEMIKRMNINKVIFRGKIIDKYIIKRERLK